LKTVITIESQYYCFYFGEHKGLHLKHDKIKPTFEWQCNLCIYSFIFAPTLF